ncbi:MAG: flagellar biosynthesis anti-sigma factor FlgM [Patescibacteria group bacterium]|nr:flagellar biosynthesis anti-sigma factor FlgM [Patescibacteria group bacterium]
MSAGDELSISEAGSKAAEAARLVDQVKQAPDVRQDRVDQIRAQIAAGTYETQQKLDVALERLLDELG